MKKYFTTFFTYDPSKSVFGQEWNPENNSADLNNPSYQSSTIPSSSIIAEEIKLITENIRRIDESLGDFYSVTNKK